jgi:hypothetical protein
MRWQLWKWIPLLLGCLWTPGLDAQRTTAEEVALLKEQVALLQEQVNRLRTELDQMKHPAAAPAPAVQNLAPAPQSLDFGGVRFSGDFRYRLDIQARSSNNAAPPLQNIRSRYRLRLNADRALHPHVGFHLQLSTGPFNNAITNDQDMAGVAAKHPFSISEAYIDYHPSPNLSLRGGRMEEAFADNMRFLWDDDIRFNGFHQIARFPVDSGFLGVKRVELRAGEYLLTNPNVVILPANSPFVAAGFRAGQKVRSTQLFHPGFVIQGEHAGKWSYHLASDVQLYRNPNQIQLASTEVGFPVLVSNSLGLALSGPMTGTGNATTLPGGAIYYARSFQVARAAYRIERKGIVLGGREMPLWLDFQASRNLGAGRLRDAVMASANLGAVRELGDLRFLYQFAIKDANALISQFTDDDLGTGTGVNLAVHALRFDLGLARFLQWQNLLFLQNQRRASNPAERFFVPLQRGANRTFRYQGHLAFTF